MTNCVEAERDLLLRYRPWLRTVAREECLIYFGHSRDAEEVGQEGWIALWLALRQDNGIAPQDWWLKMCARRRMRHVLKSRIASCRNERKTMIVDATPGEQASSLSVWVQLESSVDEIEYAYHNGEIADAISRLPRAQRSYIERRFWHGWTFAALDIYFTCVGQTWEQARNTLASQLAHLR